MGISQEDKIKKFLLYEIIEEIQSFNANSENGRKKIINSLKLFTDSENFILYILFCNEKEYSFFIDIIETFESMKKFLSFEIWATLLEELNNEQFERQIKKVLEIINNKHDKELLDSFIEQNKEKIEKQNGVGFVMMPRHIYFLYRLYSLFFKNQFKEILFPNNYKLIYIKNYEEHYKSFISYLENKNKIFKDDNKEIKEYFDFCYDYLKNLKTLNNDTRQIILFWYNIYKNEKRIKQKIGLCDYIFGCNFGNYPTININKKLIWTFYGNSSKIILEGTRTKDEIFSIDMFELIPTKSSYLCCIFKSLFSDKKIVIYSFYSKSIQQLNKELEKEKGKEKDINGLKEIIKKDIDSFITEQNLNKYINCYINLGNYIINFKNSFDSVLFESIIKKINEEQNIKKDNINKEEEKKINNNEICNENMKKIDELELNLKIVKENNKNLIDKINKLEIELNSEKNKNKELEKQLMALKNEINNEKINLNDNDLQQKLSLPLNMQLKKDPKEFLETLIEKDKEIKELKLKLSRYPFELLEDEKLMSIILTSRDEKINYSMICKSKDKFNIIENKFYEEFPEYIETENHFMLRGKKINKYKTLEDNKINNNDIIHINIIK